MLLVNEVIVFNDRRDSTRKNGGSPAQPEVVPPPPIAPPLAAPQIITLAPLQPSSSLVDSIMIA
jgi:hypothetical protein